MRRKDWLVHQLPVGMLDDPFLVRFVGIFQHLADSVMAQVDSLPHAFDPTVASEPMLRTMASWLGADIDSALDGPLQRTMVRELSATVPWRGTRRGLQHVLSSFTGSTVVVEDSGGVFPLGEAPDRPPHVVVKVGSTGPFSDRDLLRFVRAELPASVTFELFVGHRQLWPEPPPDGTTPELTPARGGAVVDGGVS